MFALADAHRCVLAGGDTTRSPQGVINMHVPEHWGYVDFSTREY